MSRPASGGCGALSLIPGLRIIRYAGSIDNSGYCRRRLRRIRHDMTFARECKNRNRVVERCFLMKLTSLDTLEIIRDRYDVRAFAAYLLFLRAIQTMVMDQVEESLLKTRPASNCTLARAASRARRRHCRVVTRRLEGPDEGFKVTRRTVIATAR